MSDSIQFPYSSSLGPVTAHEGNAYLIDSARGLIGIPSNSTPSPANVEHDIANPPVRVEVRRQETRVIIDRLTTPERAALFGSDNVEVQTLVAKALSTGAIRDDDPDFPAAVAGLDALGIIAANRWDALLAP